MLSYFYPLRIKRFAGAYNNYLELNLYCNRIQLATEDALYSDGDKYTPAVATVKHLQDFLPGVKSVLVLGAGLGSIVHVIRAKGYHPHYTLVEKDKVVLGSAMELLEGGGHIEPVCDDAEHFMHSSTAMYDLIFIDVFTGRVVPEFVYTPDFLDRCRKSLLPGGHVSFNYIVNDALQWDGVKNNFEHVFPVSSIVQKGINRILVGGTTG